MATSTRKQREIAEREELVLDVARGMLLEGGYLGLTMDRIAAATEYSKGTIYQHFPNKEEILAALAIQTATVRSDLFERASRFRGRPRERMVALSVAANLFYQLHADHFRCEQVIRTNSIRSKTSAERQAQMAGCEARCLTIVSGVIRDGIAQGDLELPEDMTPEEVGFLRARYEEEVQATDRGIGVLLAELDALGRAGDTLVVFTADHGEEFLAHGWLGHTRTLYQELVRVPLIARGPGVPAGRVVREPVSLVSLAPTLLEWLGLEHRDRGFHGDSLAPLLRGEAPERSGAVAFTEVDFVGRQRRDKDAHKKAVTGERWKLIRDDVTGRVELYDLEVDPDELDDVADARPEVVAELLSALELHLAALGAGAAHAEETELSAEELAELSALGYTESAGEEPPGDGGRPPAGD